MSGITPSQTVGPFFSHALPWPDGPYVVPAGTPEAVWLRGTVRDGDGAPVPDALIETWQADPAGRLDNPAFRGFGRCPTGVDGAWGILTVKPGPVGAGNAPYIAVSVFARGLLDRVVTRLYFAGEPANDHDPVLAKLAEADRTTLIARGTDDGYTFDIQLQGGHETVFFSV
jgi:protocatechuate 3,4-dioxygenase alpha subunit